MLTLKKNLRYIAIALGIVLVWRGIWGIADLHLFPNNQLLSFVVSILLGVSLLLLIDLRKKDISELYPE